MAFLRCLNGILAKGILDNYSLPKIIKSNQFCLEIQTAFQIHLEIWWISHLKRCSTCLIKRIIIWFDSQTHWLSTIYKITDYTITGLHLIFWIRIPSNFKMDLKARLTFKTKLIRLGDFWLWIIIQNPFCKNAI